MDRISKLYASIDNNPARVEFDGVVRPRISHTPWPFGFCLTGLPDCYFLMRLPTPHLSKTVRGISATSEVSVSSSSRSGLDLAEDSSECDFKHGDHLPPQREFTDGMAVDLSPTSSVFLTVSSLKGSRSSVVDNAQGLGVQLLIFADLVNQGVPKRRSARLAAASLPISRN